MNYALLVLSTVLLLLIIGLIFKKDFREDMLKSGNENEAEFKGIKIKGTLFWVLFAVTAFGTIYIALKNPESSGADIFSEAGEPFIKSEGGVDWVALDLNTGQPTKIYYGSGNDTMDTVLPKTKMSMDFVLNNKFKVLSKSDQVLGEMDIESLKALNLTNDLSVEKYIEIRYNIQLSPFKTTKNLSPAYDWNLYANLPFKVTVEFSQERQTHCLITDKETGKIIGEPQSINQYWIHSFHLKGKTYLVRLQSKDSTPGGPGEHANFQIMQYSGAIK